MALFPTTHYLFEEPSPRKKKSVIFHFHQASMTFNHFNSLEFQDIQFSFDAKLTNFSNLVISSGSEVSITNVNATETQQNSGEYPRIVVTEVTTTTISNFSVYFPHSSKFISVQKGEQINVSLQLSNISIEYAQSNAKNPPSGTYIISASSIQNLSATNISISSIRNTTNNSLIKIHLYSPFLVAVSITSVSISGLSISLNANYYSHLFNIADIQTLSLFNLGFTNNTLRNSFDYAIVAIRNTKNTTLNHISMSNTYMESLQQRSHSLIRINSTAIWDDITIENLSIAGNNELKDASVLAIQEAFRTINFRNVLISGLTITSGAILKAYLYYQSDNELFLRFTQGKKGTATLENFTLEDSTFSGASIFLFEQAIKGKEIPYLTYGESVIAQLTNITIKSLNISGPRSSLIVFKAVKGVISNSTFFSFNISNQSLISAIPTSSLIMDNLTLDLMDFEEDASFITIEGTALKYNGSQLFTASNKTSLKQELMVYRAFSIQNSQFQSVTARSALISSSHPYVFVVNNSFTNVSLLDNGTLGLFKDFFPDEKKYALWNMTNETDSFKNQLIGQEVSSVDDILKANSEDVGFSSLFYKNKFQSVKIDHGNLIRLEKYDLKGSLLNSEQSDNSNLLMFTRNILSNFSVSSIQELPLLQFSLVNKAIIEGNDFQLLTNMNGVFEITKTDRESASSLRISIQNNTFTEVGLASSNLIGLKVTGPIDIKNNTFETCSLSIDNSTALLDIVEWTLSKKGDFSAYVLLEANIFNNTKIRNKTSNAPTRSYLVRANLDRQQSSFTIKNCPLSISGNEIEDLTLMQISGFNVSITDTNFSEFSANQQDFGSLLEIEAAFTRIEHSLFSNLNFSHHFNPQNGLIAISWMGAQNAEVQILNSAYMNITIGQMPLYSISVLKTASITIGNDSLFSQIYWGAQLFSTYASDLTISFTESALDLSGASNQPAPTGFKIANSTATAEFTFRNSTIVLGSAMDGSLLKFEANDRRNVTFLNCSIVSAVQPSQSSQPPQLNSEVTLSATSEGPASKRLLEGSQNNSNLNQSMRLLVSRGSVILSMYSCTIDLYNMTSYPWIDLLSENASISIENSTFSNFALIPEIDNPDLIFTEYYNSLGEHFTGIVTIVAEDDTSVGGNWINVSISKTSFSNVSSRRTGVLSILNKNHDISIKLLIESSNFINLTSDYGPAISLFQSFSALNYSFLFVSKSTITSTFARRLGGAIFNNMSNLILNNSTFSENYMSSIENALFDTTTHSAISFSSEKTNFAFGIPTYLQYSLDRNQSNSGLDISECLHEGRIKTCFSNVSSYSLADSKMDVQVFDHLSLPFIDSAENAHLYVSIKGTTHTVPCKLGRCSLMDIKLSGNADDEFDLDLSYQNGYVTLEKVIHVKLRKCLPGEHNDTNSKTCEFCPPGKFSLNPQNRCEICPTNAICDGGNNLNVSKGYWRNTTSKDILKCDIKERCLGGYDSNCSDGYMGPLCLQCDANNYAAVNGCCPQNPFWIISGKALIWLLSFTYSIYVLNSQKKQNQMIIRDENSEAEARITLKQALYVDLLVTYLQVMSIVLTFKGGLLAEIFSIFGGKSVSSSKILYPDICLLFISGYSGECPQCVILIKVLLTPVIGWLLISLIYLIFFYRFKLTWKRLRRFLLFWVTFFMLSYTFVCDTLLKFLFCSDFGVEGGGSYLLHDPNTSCDSDDYRIYRYYIAIPALMLWGLVFPGIFLFSITYWVNRSPQNVREIFGQLMNPYKENGYYWSAGVMMLKFGLLLCDNLADSDNNTRALSMIIIIYLYKWLESYCNPYADQSVVKAVRLSLYAYLTTIFFTLYSQNNNLTIQIISITIILVMNGAGIGYILSFLITRTYVKVLGFIRGYVLKMFPGIEKPVRVGEKILFGDIKNLDSTDTSFHPRSQTNYICRSESSEIELNYVIRRVDTAL